MASSIAVQAWTVAVLALLRSRSALGSPHGNLPPQVYATDDAVTRSPGGLPNATNSDRDVRKDHGRHSSYDVEQIFIHVMFLSVFFTKDLASTNPKIDASSLIKSTLVDHVRHSSHTMTVRWILLEPISPSATVQTKCRVGFGRFLERETTIEIAITKTRDPLEFLVDVFQWWALRDDINLDETTDLFRIFTEFSSIPMRQINRKIRLRVFLDFGFGLGQSIWMIQRFKWGLEVRGTVIVHSPKRVSSNRAPSSRLSVRSKSMTNPPVTSLEFRVGTNFMNGTVRKGLWPSEGW
ncbi:hypothetical protein QTP88_026760 [Uroleucon formosanum]